MVIGDRDQLIVSASGIPPDWVDDIPGTEAWALVPVWMHAEPGCTFFVDCEPCVKAFHVGPRACSIDNKTVARVHAVMHAAMDDAPSEAVIWMPSHVKPGHCGSITEAMVSSSPAAAPQSAAAES